VEGVKIRRDKPFAMNIHELEQRLIEEGCNRGSFAIGSRGSASDAYCLTHNGMEQK